MPTWSRFLPIPLMFAVTVSAWAKQPWRVVSYEAVVAPAETPEGVLLVKLRRGQQQAFGASYFTEDKVRTARFISRARFEQLRKSLTKNVVPYHTRAPSSACDENVVIRSGVADSSGGSVVAREKRSTQICLSDNGSAKSDFANWYKQARGLFP
jgi:hypothetical protein